MRIIMKKIKCKRCLHEWIPRKSEIRMCPRCKTPWFDIPKNNALETESKIINK